jgi:hypothetical protein
LKQARQPIAGLVLRPYGHGRPGGKKYHRCNAG